MWRDTPFGKMPMPVRELKIASSIVVHSEAARLVPELMTALSCDAVEIVLRRDADHHEALARVDAVCATRMDGLVDSDGLCQLAVAIIGPSSQEAELAALASGAIDYIPCDQPLDVVVARVERVARLGRLLRERGERILALESLCSTDEVTGLHNQRYLFERLGEEYERARRYNYPLAVIALDIDGFKEVNDTADHLFGTYVLMEMGRILSKELRRADILCRFGGDEFFAVLPHVNSDGAHEAAERARLAITNHQFEHGSHSRRITASFGIAAIPMNQVGCGEDLLRLADQAMYCAKGLGRDCTAVSSATDKASPERRLAYTVQR
jgi:diguanylate cyclase (GGDEF)-like protein